MGPRKQGDREAAARHRPGALREARGPSGGQAQPVSRGVVQSADVSLPEAFVKTVDHFVPEFWRALACVRDPRDPLRIAYPIEMELLVGLLMFVTKVGSRRSVKFKLGTSAFASNLQVLGTQLFPKAWRPFPDSVPHGDTLNYLLKGVAPREIHVLRRLVIRSLIRKRALEGFRLLGRYYPVAIDGTGQLVFNERHCDRCVREIHDGYTLYKHPVVEAKLTVENGLALSVGTAFVENVGVADKQDCESKGFYRIAKDLKQDFPMLDICLLLDGLFANKPVMRLCKRNRWAYIITFREGSLPAVWQEYQALKGLAPKDVLVEKESGCRRTYRWVNDIDFDGMTVNAFECVEETAERTTPFIWLTGLRVSAANVVELASRGGRLRWKIENEGFNTQKNGGYELEHPYSTDTTAMKNFYLLLQVGHLINQLMEKGSMLRKRIQETMGSLKTFSQRLWAALTETFIDPERLRGVLGTRSQIRFDSG